LCPKCLFYHKQLTKQKVIQLSQTNVFG
jgi:hypothetical protein